MSESSQLHGSSCSRRRMKYTLHPLRTFLIYTSLLPCSLLFKYHHLHPQVIISNPIHCKRSKMFVSAEELVFQVHPNSFFAFIFCNLIVLVIILRLRSGFSDWETQDTFPGFYMYRNAERWSLEVQHVSQPVKQVEKEKEEDEEEEEMTLVRVTEAHDGEIGGVCVYKHEDETVEDENEDDREEDSRAYDEFTRRIEDFIAKVHRIRREEHRRDRSGT